MVSHAALGVRLGGQARGKVLRLLRPQLVGHPRGCQAGRQRPQLGLALDLQHNLERGDRGQGAKGVVELCLSGPRALCMLSSASGWQYAAVWGSSLCSQTAATDAWQAWATTLPWVRGRQVRQVHASTRRRGWRGECSSVRRRTRGQERPSRRSFRRTTYWTTGPSSGAPSAPPAPAAPALVQAMRRSLGLRPLRDTGAATRLSAGTARASGCWAEPLTAVLCHTAWLLPPAMQRATSRVVG